jgi:hypothetical protein
LSDLAGTAGIARAPSIPAPLEATANFSKEITQMRGDDHESHLDAERGADQSVPLNRELGIGSLKDGQRQVIVDLQVDEQNHHTDVDKRYPHHVGRGKNLPLPDTGRLLIVRKLLHYEL